METHRNTPAIADKTLHDPLGNTCRITMYQMARDTFELYTVAFNSSVPGRFVGNLADCNTRATRWLETVKEAGFKEELPSFPGCEEVYLRRSADKELGLYGIKGQS